MVALALPVVSECHCGGAPLPLLLFPPPPLPPPRAGGLIYQLMGDAAESSFVRDWGIGLAIDQTGQWRDVVKGILIAVTVLLVLERLKLSSPLQWLETQADFMSVTATLLTGRPTTWWQRMKAHVSFFERVENGKG